MSMRYKNPSTGEWVLIATIPGPKGQDGNVSFDELTPEQREMLRGEKGEDGKNAYFAFDIIDNDLIFTTTTQTNCEIVDGNLILNLED